MTRTRNSAFNLLSTSGVSIATMLLSLLTTPLILRWLGQERLGMFRAAGDWMNYLILLEFGLGGALMPLLADALNRADPAERSTRLRTVLAAGFRGYRKTFVLTLAGSIVLIAIVPHLIRTSSDSARLDLRIAVAVLSIGVLAVPFAPLRPLWEAQQRSYVINLLLAAQMLMLIGLSVLFARAGFGASGQALAVSIALIAYVAALIAFSIRRHGADLLHAFRSDDRTADAQVRRLNWPSFVLSMSGRIALMTDNILIAYFLGPLAVVPFIMTQRLAQIAQGQLQSVGNATWASLAHLHSAEGEIANAGKLAARLTELTQAILILGIAAIVPIIGFNERFVARWLGREQFAGQALTTLACVNAILLAVISLWGWLFSATGRIRVLVRPSIVACVVNFGVSVGVTFAFHRTRPVLAILGPLIGTTAGFTLVSGGWLLHLLRREFAIPSAPLLRAIVVPALLALPLIAAARWLAMRQPSMSWPALLIELPLISLACLLIGWRLLLGRERRAMWKHRLAHVLGPDRGPRAANGNERD